MGEGYQQVRGTAPGGSTACGEARAGRRLRGALLAALFLLPACAQLDTGAPRPAAPAAQTPAVPDATIRKEIERRWQEQGSAGRGVDLSVSGGRVLLTGRARTPDQRVDAVRLAWQADGVTEVINEIQIDDESGLTDKATDLWISTRIRSKLLFDADISSGMFSVDTVNGTVYVMGRARSQVELDRVLSHVRAVPRVRRVVNHVVL
ncbi:BON domain-containing protein [Rhodocista pekingensis]|uniref:BON domain-containing protein n=1 Tax=Rhodocista pekingensis TaxID=201185 RepID=A0ABW2KSD6_9PROT